MDHTDLLQPSFPQLIPLVQTPKPAGIPYEHTSCSGQENCNAQPTYSLKLQRENRSQGTKQPPNEDKSRNQNLDLKSSSNQMAKHHHKNNHQHPRHYVSITAWLSHLCRPWISQLTWSTHVCIQTQTHANPPLETKYKDKMNKSLTERQKQLKSVEIFLTGLLVLTYRPAHYFQVSRYFMCMMW